MNYKKKLSISMILLLNCIGISGVNAATTAIKNKQVRLIFRYPMAPQRYLSGAWLEAWSYADPIKPQLLKRVSFDSFRSASKFSLSADEKGNLVLMAVDSKGKSLIVAQSQWTKGWYPPAEICITENQENNCRVVVERNDDMKSLNFQLVTEK